MYLKKEFCWPLSLLKCLQTLEMIKREQEEQQQQHTTIIKKTHKGEIEIDDDGLGFTEVSILLNSTVQFHNDNSEGIN